MPARLAAGLGLIALITAAGAASATPRNVATEVVGEDALTIQTDDDTHQGSLLLNGRPLIQNPAGAVGIDGIFATPAKTYVLAGIGENASCYRYQIVTLTGQQGAVSAQFGNCLFAAGNLDKGVLHIRLRPAMSRPTRAPEETHTYDGQSFH